MPESQANPSTTAKTPERLRIPKLEWLRHDLSLPLNSGARAMCRVRDQLWVKPNSYTRTPMFTMPIGTLIFFGTGGFS